MKRTRFAEYKDRYENYRFELSEDGILLMQCHTDGRTGDAPPEDRSA